MSPNINLRQSEPTTIPGGCGQETLVPASVRNKSSWLALYTMVWGSRNFLVEPFRGSPRWPCSWVEKEPKKEPIGNFCKYFLKIGTWLVDERKPFGKILSHDFVGSGQKVVKSTQIDPYLPLSLKTPKKWNIDFRDLLLSTFARSKRPVQT